MERALMSKLVAWRDSPSRKPLVLNGARQVGKTWLLKEFGRLHFKSVAYLSLDNDSLARSYFEPDFNVRRIIASISLQLDRDIDPEDTLIVLDEIQACPRAITALKYFCEDAPAYHVAAAGSLLGISASEGTGFPVGKVNALDLYPLSFDEYLRAAGKGRLAALLEAGDQTMIASFADTLVRELKTYYVVGGMPEAVSAFMGTGDPASARAVHTELLGDYERDFAKRIPTRLLARTMLAWESVPKHLSRENKKFVFGQVRQGARAADFEESLMWLEQAGLIICVPRVAKPGIPLSAYRDGKAFKVFLLDVGLLGALCGLEPTVILDGSRVFTEFKGALTEQYVCQQLISSCGLVPFYWSADNSRGEIDFLVQVGGAPYAIEVKAEENLKAKSLRAFCERNEGVRARRFSLSGYRDEGWMENVPLYAVGHLDGWR